MLKPLYKLIAIIFIVFGSTSFGQVTYQIGSGSVASGVTVSTDNFSKYTSVKGKVKIPNIVEYKGKVRIDPTLNSPPEGSNYKVDPNAGKNPAGISGQGVLVEDFNGIDMTNSIPPDPHMAVGPTHILACVNTTFRIWDKEGNILKTISADSWFQSTLPNPGAFDPQIMYDHYAKRWIMLWDNQSDNTQTGYFLISVSDDSIPLGTWYNWAVPTNLNGSINSGTWGDYPGVGYDQQAYYIHSNQFSFSSGFFQYSKIRIIDKSELYANTPGQLDYTDMWNITYPTSGDKAFTIRPSITYGNQSDYYLLHAPYSANFMTLYKITNPISNPVLTGVNVPVTFYNSAPNASQLGGGTALEAGGSYIRHAPIYQDGFIYASHAVRNPTSASFSSLAYVKINTSSNSAVEDQSMGASGYWYMYPNLTLDKDGNIAITYSRSSFDEYIGAFYTTKQASDPPGLSGSKLLKEGQGNYVVTFGSGRNRWGDYMGAFRDPSDENSLWIFTEYAAATNTWGTWVGKLRMVPFNGIYSYTDKNSYDFGNIEKNTISDTATVIISNYGSSDLVISDIPLTIGPFHIINNITFPYTVSTYDTLMLKFNFVPTDTGAFSEHFNVTSNDTSLTGYDLSGRGYEINAAYGKTMYAASGQGNDANLLTIDLTSGQGSIIGNSPYDDVSDFTSMSIDPHTNLLYGISTNATETKVLRINAYGGDAYNMFTIPLGNLYALAFDTSGTLYSASKTGELYKIDLGNQSYQFLDSTHVNIDGMAFSTVTNELFATKFVPVIGDKDLILKIDVNTGDTTTLGFTGYSSYSHNDLAFDENGTLYAAIGSPSQINKLISIDTTTGVGTLLGDIGYKDVAGLAYSINGEPTYAKNETSTLPANYELKQNYPNPFNPSTTINYSIPYASQVKIVVYNLLGEVVKELINGEETAGNHSIRWNARNNYGTKVSSGIYFYQIKASSNDGKQFTQTRKMVLLK